MINRAGASGLSKEELEAVGINLVQGDSGPGYMDQSEITWEQLTALSGSPEKLIEFTSATQLPRRVFTFSRTNVREAIRHNRTNGMMHLSLNFGNYVDCAITGQRGRHGHAPFESTRLEEWLRENMEEFRSMLKFIGTGAKTDDMIQLP